MKKIRKKIAFYIQAFQFDLRSTNTPKQVLKILVESQFYLGCTDPHGVEWLPYLHPQILIFIQRKCQEHRSQGNTTLADPAQTAIKKFYQKLPNLKLIPKYKYFMCQSFITQQPACLVTRFCSNFQNNNFSIQRKLKRLLILQDTSGSKKLNLPTNVNIFVRIQTHRVMQPQLFGIHRN